VKASLWGDPFLHLVPQGRLNLAQDVSPGFHLKKLPSPAGTTGNYRGLFGMPGRVILSRPYGTSLVSLNNPGLESWAKFRRPCGTGFVNDVLTSAAKQAAEKLNAGARGGRYGLQPVHKSSRTIRPLGPEVCSSPLLLRKTVPQGLKATEMTRFMPGINPRPTLKTSFSAASKAVVGSCSYGTAKAVPFVEPWIACTSVVLSTPCPS
jgi:hypothetical protein